MTKPDQADVPRWTFEGFPLGPLGAHNGRLTFCGTAIPTSNEVGQLYDAARERADELFASVGSVEARVRSTVHRRNWAAADARTLHELYFQAVILNYAAERLGNPALLPYGLLLAEGGGLLLFVLSVWYLEALALLRAEIERRQAEHPYGAYAGALAVAMRRDFLRERPEVEHTLAALQRAVRVPRSARAKITRGTRPGEVHGGSLIEPLGQVYETIMHEINTDPIRALADAIEGRLDHIPVAIARDLQNEAEKHRRWEGRRGRHAEGAPRLESGVDVDAMPGAETPEEALGRQESEGHERVLEMQADAVLGAAAEQEKRGRKRSAQLLRADLYRKLGGKSRRTPETRKRPPRSR